MKNPIISENAGDPYILKDGKDYYLSATCSESEPAGIEKFNGFLMWHSTDLEHWSNPVKILDFEDIPWAHQGAWAPSMVESDGYYYFAFVADQQIGIAVCDTPMGTYREMLGKPLIAKEDYDFQTIDPCFLKTDDGTVYLAFGQGKCLMSEILLTPDSAELTGPMECLSEMIYRQYSIPTPAEIKSVYNEAPDLIKVGDRYLFSWAIYDVLDYRYAVRYAWSPDPMGPYILPLDYDHDNILLQGAHDITGCGHACITEYQGEYYIAYGRHKKTRTRKFEREMCIEKICFLDDDHLIAIPTASQPSK